jgi:hypothetical protein
MFVGKVAGELYTLRDIQLSMRTLIRGGPVRRQGDAGAVVDEQHSFTVSGPRLSLGVRG